MALPKYNELYKPILEVIQDGKIYCMKETATKVAENLNLSLEDLAEQLPSQRQTIFINRLNWAKTYLKKAGLIESPSRGNYLITSEGKALLNSGVPITNEYLKTHYPSFARFVNGSLAETEHDASAVVNSNHEDERTPEEQLDSIHKTLNEILQMNCWI